MNKAINFVIPEPKEGEIYAGTIINPDGTGKHTFLLPGDNDDADWQTQMEWAASIGGELPDRVQQAMLNKNLPELFQKDYYWSCEQRGSGSAWFQYVRDGYHYWISTSTKCRARAVRSVAI